MKPFKFYILILLSLSAPLFSQPRAEETNQIEMSYPSLWETNTQSILNSSDITSALIEINNVYRYIDANFLYEVDVEKVKEGLAKGLMDSLGDEYSYYIPASQKEEFKEDSVGQYVGIGTYLTKINPSYADESDPKTYMVQIIAPFPGGPADRAGLKPNDLISHVNGQDISDLNATEASKLIRGKENESITLTIVRGESSFDITLMPEVVTTPNLTKGVLEGNIGYILIYEFNLQTGNLVAEAVKDLMKQGIKSLILDLRNNGGGIVDSSLQIADLFLDDGTLLTIKYKENSRNKPVRYIANPTTIIDKDLPLVILTNGGTASSSEILTAALKENNRATVIGSKTFGKGIMQSVINFLGGYVQFTYAHYLTPQDNDIHKVGIEPDIKIEETEYSDEEMKAYAEFVNTNKAAEFKAENPEYSIENIEKFALLHKDSKVPPLVLKLLMRNEYIYSMNYNDRPVADTHYDETLKTAIEYLKKVQN